MKAKFLIFLGLFLGFTAGAANSELERLNAAIQVLLRPYHSNVSHADFKFTELSLGKNPSVLAKAYGMYLRSGKIDNLALNIKNISINSTDVSKPVAEFDATVGVNLTKFVPERADLNSLIEDAEETVKSIIAEFLTEYGPAAIITARVTEKIKDSQGNYVSFKGSIDVTMDLSKLPSNVRPEQVPFLKITGTIGVDIFKGAEIKLRALFNPANRWVKDDQGSIRAYAQRIMDQEKVAMETISGYLKSIDEAVGNFLDGSQ
jgi:hypothetical protein